MAANILTDYVSQDVYMIWNGIPLLAPADQFVTVSYEEEQVVVTQGPDGSVAHSLLPSTLGTITVTLQQESPTHLLLTALLAVQKRSRTIQRGTFLLTNLNGASLYTGVNACITEPPEIAYGKTHEDGLRTWTFKCAELVLAG
jgi:hypothetical protein